MTVFHEAEMLRHVPFFEKLDAAKLKLIAFTSRAARFAAGELLMAKGEPSDSTYVILEGEVEVLGDTPHGEFVVSVIGARSLVGEISVILSGTRVASVRARTEVRALAIPAETFRALFRENPSCSQHLIFVLSQRLIRSTHKLEELTTELAEARSSNHYDAMT